jgi:hypothetical protein
LEKNSALKVTPGKHKYGPGTEMRYAIVGTSNPITLNTFMTKALEKMGVERFFVYHPFYSNCQNFIHNMLLANLMLTNDTSSWVMQPLGDIAQKNPFISNILQGVTDVHGIISGSGVGGGSALHTLRRPKHRNHLHV